MVFMMDIYYLFLCSFRPSTSRSQDTWQRLGLKTRARGNANELAKSLEFRLHGQISMGQEE